MSNMILSPFNFNSQLVRVIVIDNNVWFVAADISKILDYSKASRMLPLVDPEDKREINPQNLADTEMVQSFNNNTFKVSIINESGLYACIFGSTKPEAKNFKRWVTSEVLPSIRKTGSYAIAGFEVPKTFSEALMLAGKLQEQNELLEIQKNLLEEQNEHLSEAVDELFSYSSIVRVAKFNKIHESNFKWQTLKATSIKLGIEIKRVPDARYEYKLLYHHDAWRIAYPNVKLPETTTLVVQK